MKNLWTVAEFTMKDMLKRKSFIISLVIILAFIVVGFNIPRIMEMFQGDNNWDTRVLIIDEENIFEGSIEYLDTANLGYRFIIAEESLNDEEIKAKIESNETDICVRFNKVDGKVSMEYIVESAAMDFGEVPQSLVNAFVGLYSNVQISKIGLTEEELNALSPEFDIKIIETDENAAKGNVVICMLISIVLFYAVFFCAGQVSSSITTEKTSKIMETLITSTKPRTIVLGKTIGIGIVGLLQVTLIIIVSVLSARFCMDRALLESLFDLSTITPSLAIITLIYFILGYALYSLFFALTGSSISKPEDVQSANSPVSFIAVIGFYLAYFSMINPSSSINKISAILPISSPFSMPLRVMMGTATTNDILISLAILIVTIAIVAKIAIKVYSSAILNYGSRMSIKEMLRAYKQKEE